MIFSFCCWCHWCENTIYPSQLIFWERWFLLTPSMLQMLLFCSVQSLSHVRLFATPWTEAHQASLSITNSQSLLKLMSIESVPIQQKKRSLWRCNQNSWSLPLFLGDQEASVNSQEQRADSTLQPNEDALSQLSHWWGRQQAPSCQVLSFQRYHYHNTRAHISFSLVRLPAPWGHRLGLVFPWVYRIDGWMDG